MAPDKMFELNGFSTPKVDITDLAFQADKAHAPDKESTWKYPAELDGWVRAHNSIRAEVDKMLKVLKYLGDRELKSWEVAAIQEWWAGHEDHIHGHHHNEDKIFNPFLRTRIAYPEKLEVDHVGLVEILNEIKLIIETLTNAKELVSKWKAYRALLFPHLHEEEQVGLPLARAYFTQPEIAPVVQQILKKASPIELGSFFHHIGGKKEIMAFMQQEGIPFFVWYLHFKGLRALYREKMESKIEALLGGVAPGAASNRRAVHKKDLALAMAPILRESLFTPPCSPRAIAMAA